MKSNLIVAVGEDGVIGRNNQLPWHIPADLKYFQRLTTGHCVIMGRKTYESLGGPLPNRHNIVLTRQKTVDFSGCDTCHSLEQALALAQKKRNGKNSEIFIIGGATLYQQALQYANCLERLYITEIFQKTDDGDAFFPSFDKNEWVEKTREAPETIGVNRQPSFHFVTYERLKQS